MFQIDLQKKKKTGTGIFCNIKLLAMDLLKRALLVALMCGELTNREECRHKRGIQI